MTIGGTMSTVTTLQFRSKPALALSDLLSQNIAKGTTDPRVKLVS